MIKGDQIKLVKPMGLLKNVGENYEVINVNKEGIITFRCGEYLLGCMSYDEFLKHFELVKKTEPKKVWSEWVKGKMYYCDIKGEDAEIILFYRHNGKRVQVKCDKLNLVAESSCHNDDKFDLDKGLSLATKRLVVKILNQEVEKLAKEM